MNWIPIDESTPRHVDLILFFPAKTHGPTNRDVHTPMKRVGRIADYPNREPTHFMSLPSDPKPAGTLTCCQTGCNEPAIYRLERTGYPDKYCCDSHCTVICTVCLVFEMPLNIVDIRPEGK